MKKETWKTILQVIVSILTVLAALKRSRCQSLGIVKTMPANKNALLRYKTKYLIHVNLLLLAITGGQ